MSGVLGTDVLCQIAIVVRDIEKARRDYKEILGLEFSATSLTDGYDKSHATYRGKATSARAKLAFAQLGPGVSMELIEPVGGPSTWQEFLDAGGEGVHHVAFNVKGMEGILSALGEKGVETVQRGDYTGGRYAYADGQEKLGVILELLENL